MTHSRSVLLERSGGGGVGLSKATASRWEVPSRNPRVEHVTVDGNNSVPLLCGCRPCCRPEALRAALPRTRKPRTLSGLPAPQLRSCKDFFWEKEEGNCSAMADPEPRRGRSQPTSAGCRVSSPAQEVRQDPRLQEEEPAPSWGPWGLWDHAPHSHSCAGGSHRRYNESPGDRGPRRLMPH